MMRRVMLVALVGLIAMAGFGSAAPAVAQDPDCYEWIYEWREQVFGPGIVIGRWVKSELSFDSACATVQDDRVNQDNYSEAAIYCRPDGVAVWDLDDLGRGTHAFTVTWSVLDNFPAGAENQLIVDRGGFRLYRLTSGELQLNSPPNWEGKEYVFTWAGCERESV